MHYLIILNSSYNYFIIFIILFVFYILFSSNKKLSQIEEECKNVERDIKKESDINTELERKIIPKIISIYGSLECFEISKKQGVFQPNNIKSKNKCAFNDNK